MKQKLCVLLLLCLAVVLVKSESSIEVDENGHEYEVKRFNIQGRQLNGAPHCVVSRRRRDTSGYGATAAIDGEVEESNANVEESIAEIYNAAPSAGAPTATLAPETDEDEAEGEDVEGEVNQELDLHDVALAAQYQSGVQSAAVAAATAENGIVVVHAHDPPKVNGQTHAIFELLPVHPEDGPIDYSSEEPFDYVDEDDILNVNEETNPVTTTAIWSTGDGNDLYDELDVHHTIKKPKKKKKPSASRPARRPSNNKNKKKKKSSNKKKSTKKTTSRPLRRRPTQKRPARRPSTNTNRRPLRRRPAQNNANKRVVKKKRNQNRNGFKQQQQNNNNRRINANLNQQNRNRRKNRPLEDIDQGTNTYTNTVTETDDGNDDQDRDVNCIIINKDTTTTTTTTTTTPRPFWNILGRDAGNVPAASGQFGKRKRVGIRFVA